MSHRTAFSGRLLSLTKPNPAEPLPRRRRRRRNLASFRDDVDADTEPPGVCLSDDDVENLFEDLDALKARLSLVEEIEQALSTIEARVDQLDTKLVGLCDSDLERSILISKLLQEREEVEQEREKRSASLRKKPNADESRQPIQPTQPAHPTHPAFDTSILSHPFHSNKQTPQPPQPPQPPPPQTPDAPIKKTIQDHEREKTERAWQQYRGSFTIILTKGYLQAVDNLRQRMMVMEYETNLQHIARRNAIARFVHFCAITKEPSIDFATTEALFENPRDLTVIQDEHLRMRCQSLIRTEEGKMKEKCFVSCTEESRRLAGVFSKTDFLAKVLPDPIEHGLVSSVETLMGWYQATKRE